MVLLDGDFPDERLMQQVAAELRYSETAFVQQQDVDEFTLRYFTPAGEVDLCGHATIASFHLMWQKGILSDDRAIVNHTLAGDLMVRIDEQVMMQIAAPRLVDASIDTDRLHRIMAGDAAVVWPEMPIEAVSTGLPDIIMPVGDLASLNNLQPDMEALAALSRELNVVGVHAFALSDDDYTAHVRNFGPLYDIPEESATGTANAALTHYLHRRRLVASGDACRFMQGEAMGRPSVVATVLKSDGSIWVGGNACIVAEGELLI